MERKQQQAKPLSRRLVIAERPQKHQATTSANMDASLVDLCRAVIVAHLERYPPEVFGSCDEQEWEAIVRLRHKKTQPKQGLTAGLDGTGRMAPAVSDKFLRAVEESNSHLRESAVADALVWRDCTEYSFRRGGLSRAKGLQYPWPELIKGVQEAAEELQQQVLGDSEDGLRKAVETMWEFPMNVSLLQATGVGKVIRKAVKTLNKQNRAGMVTKRLEKLLNSYKALAGGDDSKQAAAAAAQDSDLQVAETCQTWRQLFAVLREREDERRSNQGKRMREIRRNLAVGRPKVVKVRPTSAKQNRVLDRSPAQAPSPHSKMAQVRREAAVSRSKRAPPVKSSGKSFSDAVAFVSGTKKHKSKRKHTMHALGGDKRLKMPTAPSRHFTSKFRDMSKR